MKNSHRFFYAIAFMVMAAFAFPNTFAISQETGKNGPNSDPEEISKGANAEVAVKPPVKCLRWNAPGAEAMWAQILNAPVENLITTLSNSEAFIQGGEYDDTKADGQMEFFGTRYMPNLYAQYQELCAKALELGQIMEETFPNGPDSDPTGGEMFEKASKKVAETSLRAIRRENELCFFLLFHQAGIFSDEELAEYDSRPISIHLAPASNAWPDDTPKANAPLSAEDSTFAAKYLPETLSGYQRLCGLFDEGAKQYAELRRTALALCATRARLELMMLKNRLEEIRKTLLKYQQDLSRQRLEHTFDDTTAEQLAELDQSNAVKIQKYEQEMGVKAYVARAAAILTVTLPGGATMEMVWCPPGTFTMGSNDGDDDETPHQVTLTKGFWMGKTEVTQAQWESVMGNNPSRFEGDNRPVENVRWNDAQQFCQKTGLQLPTEAQWEYACRAGSTGEYAGTGNLDDMGWYDRNSDYETHPVGMKQPNAWGLYDMHGNVWEWCADWCGEYPSGAVTDPQGPWSGEERVARGGSWYCNAEYCTASKRGYFFHSNAYLNHYGFRLVRPLSE